MTNPNWGILQPVDVGAKIQQGYEHGRKIQADNALSQYATNPDDPKNMNALAKYHPQVAMKVRQDQEEKAKVARETDIKMRASRGEPDAIAALAGVDWNAWKGLQPDKKDMIKAQSDYIGQAALRISQMPAAQQPQAWDAYVQQGVQLGYSDLAQYQGKFDPNQLQAAIANAGKVQALFDLEKPSYQVIPEGGTMVNTKDPAALARVNQQNQFVPPPAGFVLDEGGPTQPASGNFRP